MTHYTEEDLKSELKDYIQGHHGSQKILIDILSKIDISQIDPLIINIPNKYEYAFRFMKLEKDERVPKTFSPLKDRLFMSWTVDPIQLFDCIPDIIDLDEDGDMKLVLVVANIQKNKFIFNPETIYFYANYFFPKKETLSVGDVTIEDSIYMDENQDMDDIENEIKLFYKKFYLKDNTKRSWRISFRQKYSLFDHYTYNIPNDFTLSGTEEQIERKLKKIVLGIISETKTTDAAIQSLFLESKNRSLDQIFHRHARSIVCSYDIIDQ